MQGIPQDAAVGGRSAVPSSGEIVYEIEASLEPDAVAEYDAWLPGHAREVLASPGFLSVELLRPADALAGDRPRRLSRYRVRDRGALEAYLETRAPALREDAAKRFGERARFERRVLAAGARLAASGTESHCANCGAVLHGPWCGACGQLARESARSLGTLFHDAWHVFTHVDGTLWRTLGGLLLKPGFLTNEYFRDKRASYIPPFRLYLVISLAFFALASLTGSLVGVPPEVAADPEARTQREQVAATAAAAPSTPTPAPRAETASRPAVSVVPRDAPTDGMVLIEPVRGGPGILMPAEQCGELEIRPAWLETTLRRLCERATVDQGRSLARAFVGNVPKMMFVFLPLMAAAMLLLYWRPRRYYVEHLVFYLHVHAAVFLVLTLLVLSGTLAGALPVLAPAVAVAGPAAFLYSAWYVWRAMRVHYRNGAGLTALKFVAIAFVYLVALSFTLLGTVVVSALTA